MSLGKDWTVLSWVPNWARWGFPLVIVVAVVAFVIWPQLDEAESAWDAARRIDPRLLLAATGLQAASFASQVQLTRVVVPAAYRPTFASMGRVELATMAVSHTVPGGTAAGTAVAYRLLTHGNRVPTGDAGFALAIRGIGSAVVLNVILWLALVVSIPTHGFAPLYTLAAGLGVLLIGGFGALVLLLMRRERRAQRIVTTLASRLPILDPRAVCDALRGVATRLQDFFGNRRLAVAATAWSSAYWLLSAASLWIFLAALGESMRADELLVAFGLANVLAALPITPRGLGLVEGVLIPALVGFGAAGGTATVAVVAWRLVSFWLPIPLGGLAYASLKVARPARTPDAAAVTDPGRRLQEATEEVRQEVGGLGEWARRHGFRIGENG